MTRIGLGPIVLSVVCMLPSPSPSGGKQSFPFDYVSRQGNGGDNFSVALSGDGRTIAVGGSYFIGKGGWEAWDVRSEKLLCGQAMIGGNSLCLALSSNGDILAAGGHHLTNGEGDSMIYHVRKQKVLGRLRGHLQAIEQIGFSPDDKYVFTASHDQTLRVWTTTDLKPVATYRFTSTNPFFNLWKEQEELPHEKAPITIDVPQPVKELRYFAISPDGALLAVTTGTNDVLVFAPLTGKLVQTINLPDIPYTFSIAFSKDGTLLAVGNGGENSKIILWDMKKGAVKATFRKHSWSARWLAISPDNKTLLSGGVVDGAKVWDVETQRLKYRLRHMRQEGENRIMGVAFMPDGKTFMTLKYGRTPAQFWETASGTEIKSGR